MGLIGQGISLLLSLCLLQASQNILAIQEKREGWQLLFNGKNLEGWTVADHPEAWTVQDGTLYCTGRGGGMLYSEERFQDFELKLEFKVAPYANSGVFLRVWDKNDPVNTGIEVQILDSYGKQRPGRHDCGAIYDIIAPSQNACKPAGEWNTYHILCKGSQITVHLNGTKIVQIDLNEWAKPGWNPDGTPNKFRYAYKEMVKPGYIALQNHGHEVWFRNIKIRPLK